VAQPARRPVAARNDEMKTREPADVQRELHLRKAAQRSRISAAHRRRTATDSRAAALAYPLRDRVCEWLPFLDEIDREDLDCRGAGVLRVMHAWLVRERVPAFSAFAGSWWRGRRLTNPNFLGGSARPRRHAPRPARGCPRPPVSRSSVVACTT